MISTLDGNRLERLNVLGGLLVVGLLGLENVGYELLRVAIVHGEPGALHLHHDAVAFLEDVIRGVQIDRKGLTSPGFRGSGFSNELW